MRTVSNGQQQSQKRRKKLKVFVIKTHALIGQKFVKTSLTDKKLISRRKNVQILKAKTASVVSFKNEISSKPPQVLLPSTSLLSSSLTLSGLKCASTTSSTSISPTLSPTLSPSSSPSDALQTLPSPTDEFKSWPSSSSSSLITTAESLIDNVDVKQVGDKKYKNDEKNSVVEDNLNKERLRQNIERLTAVATLLSTTTGYSTSNNNNNNNNNNNDDDGSFSNNQRNCHSARRLTSDNNSRTLLWQNHHQQQQQGQQQQQQYRQYAENDRRHHIQILSVTSPQFVINNNNNNNVNTVNNNNNVGYNLNNGFGIGFGVKRPLVQDDPSEPEPTSKENIKRIKIANGGYQNVGVLDDRYLFIRKIEGTTFYYCIDAKARKRLMCKVSLDPCTKLIEAHARLNGHPCISQLLKVIRKDNKTYMFFPMSQDDLLSYVRRRKRLPERDARFLFRQMCAIVRSCHNQGIVLRDLKLRKFIFSDGFKKHLKLESLVDAVVLDDPTNDLLKEKRGCPVYVAPEILKATQTYCGKAADMWSLGVILYTMLIGRYPFSDTEHAGLFAKISRGQFILPDIITSKARCLIRCLLRQEPEERITSDDIFYHPWMNVNDATEINLLNTDQCVPNNDFIIGDNNNNNNNNNNSGTLKRKNY